MRLHIWLLSSVLAFAIPGLALADDQMTPLAADGDWIALSHAPSVEDPPDICLAASLPQYGFGLRIDDQGNIDIRYSNDSWSLPANVTGNLKISVNGHKYSYAIQGNTSTTVDAPLTQDQLTSLVTDMEIASSMQVTAGSGAPASIPLDGSKASLTALLTCAGIQNPTNNTGGANPFGTPANQ